eukprot:8739675-Ditylum_brightwellii.AAC.1
MTCTSLKPLEHFTEDLIEYLEQVEHSENENPSNSKESTGSKNTALKANTKQARTKDEKSQHTPKKTKSSYE